MRSVLENLKSLGVARLATMGAVGLAMLAMLTMLALHGGGSPQMALLYGNLDTRDVGQIATALDKAHIRHELGGQDDQILVPADEVASARLLLAKSNLPSGGSIGYEIFDRGDGFTATQFEQNINLSRALEGELTRSIRLINGIRGARVHLVLPHREPFAAEQQPAQASVLLSMIGSSQLDPEGVQAILNLVAAAVPGLKTENIAIIDSRGNVLSKVGTPGGAFGIASNIDAMRQAAELRLSRSVEEMLEPTLGSDHVRAEAAVTMDVEQVRQTQETYDPDQQVLRSQQTTSDKSHNTEAQPNTSVQNNLPNANAGSPQVGSEEQKQEEVSNYEIGKTVRTVIQDQPRVARISLAVMVDGTTTTGVGGKPIWIPRTQAELDQIATLAKSAIGFDAKRGDTVSVVSMRFARPDTTLTVATFHSPLGIHLSRDEILRLGQTGLLGSFILLSLLFVVRPVMLRLAASPSTVGPVGHLPGVIPGVSTAPLQELQRGTTLLGPPAAGTQLTLLPASDSDDTTSYESTVSIANVDGRLKASSIRQLVEVVAKHPEESLSILRGWLGNEQGAG